MEWVAAKDENWAGRGPGGNENPNVIISILFNLKLELVSISSGCKQMQFYGIPIGTEWSSKIWTLQSLLSTSNLSGTTTSYTAPCLSSNIKVDRCELQQPHDFAWLKMTIQRRRWWSHGQGGAKLFSLPKLPSSQLPRPAMTWPLKAPKNFKEALEGFVHTSNGLAYVIVMASIIS